MMLKSLERPAFPRLVFWCLISSHLVFWYVLAGLFMATYPLSADDVYTIRKSSSTAAVSGTHWVNNHLAANPANGFDAWISANGVRVQSRSTDGWEVGLTLRRVGRNDALVDVTPAAVEASGSRAELHRGRADLGKQPGSLVEWYVNNEKGLEQGFNLEAPPFSDSFLENISKDHEVVLELEISGDLVPMLDENGQRVSFVSPRSHLASLVYGKLAVFDATGHVLPARMELGDGNLRIVFEDKGAVYPVVVDPLLTTAAWSSPAGATGDIAWGDWDGDGDLDLVAANHFGQPIELYENTGTDLVSAWSSPALQSHFSVAWGDWDGDGDLDLAVGDCSLSNPDRVYENVDGDLTAIWSSPETLCTRNIAWGDWDNDGDLDLVVARRTDSGSSSQNVLYENTGNDLQATWVADEMSDDTEDVAWGDFDRDGDLDLAIGNNHTQPNRIYLNTGGMLSLAWTSVEADSTIAVAWGDWDHDGDLDLAVANHGQPNRIYENNDGNFTAVWASSDKENSRDLAWGDWDGDGDLDLAVANLNQPNRVYENTGGNLVSTWTSVDSLSTKGIAWGDWDGDGDLDLAAANDGNTAEPNYVYENTGNAMTVAWTSDEVGGGYRSTWGDWDGDGDLDLAISNMGLANRVYENDGGTLVLTWTSTEIEQTVDLAWGDWDGDGDLDLAAANHFGEPNRVYENIGGDLVSAWVSSELESSVGAAWGDWDGDGDLDLAIGNFDDEANRVYENISGHLISAWVSEEAESSIGVAWGDWNGDGLLDLAVGNDRHPNRVYTNTGGELVLTWTAQVAESTFGVAWGDWDGDGDLDLAVGNQSSTHPNRVYQNTGSDFELAWTALETDSTNIIAWGDWDNDGDLDLATSNFNGVDRIYENAEGSLHPAWASAESNNTTSVEWGDWDNDGDLDLATGNEGLEPRVVFENPFLNQLSHLPQTPTSPVVSKRPGTTAAGPYHSTPELLSSPVRIDYILRDEESDPARRITAEYSLTGGGSWHAATELISSGTENLAASPEGTPHYFYWDATADGVVRADNIVFRITVPYQASTRLAGPIQRAALSATSPPFRIGNPVADLAVTNTNNQTVVTAGQSVLYDINVTNHGPADVVSAVLSDTFPPSITDVTWDCDDISGVGDLHRVINLQVGESFLCKAYGTVSSGVGAQISNTATITAPAGITDNDLSNNSATDTDWTEPPSDAVRTLILTHPERMAEAEGESFNAEALSDGLLRLAGQFRVQGKVIDLSDNPEVEALYDSWDAQPANADLANDVLFAEGGVYDAIRDLLDAHPAVEYLILVGGDNVIPFARFADQTQSFRESVYTNDPSHPAWGLSPTQTTVGQALAADFYLSDDPIGSREPLSSSELATSELPFLPDLAVGRMVEEVDHIVRVVDAFIANDGLIDLTDTANDNKVAVSGYHFLLDTAKTNRTLWKQALGDFTQGTTTTPVNDTLVKDSWDEQDLLGVLCNDSPYGVLNLNGHATHWQLGVPGNGPILYSGLETTDLLSPDPSFCDGPPRLDTSIVYTADCHGGLPVPNVENVDESLDLPEAMASLGVTAYLANTGFGWGLRCSIGYSELLTHMFSEQLIAEGTASLGKAANAAKSRYLSETLRIDPYDLKVLRQWHLSGIPNVELRVGPPAFQADESRSIVQQADGSLVEQIGSVTVESREVQDSDMPPGLTKTEYRTTFADEAYTKYNTEGDIVAGSCLESLPEPDPDQRLDCEGCYYTLNGLTERITGEADLPVQPYFVYKPDLSGVVLQDTLWLGGVYEREEDWKPLFGTLISQGPDGEGDRTSLPRKIYIKPRGELTHGGGVAAFTCEPDSSEQATVVFTTAELEDDPASDDTYSILKLHKVVELELFYLDPGSASTSCDNEGPTFGAPIEGESHHHLEDRAGEDWLHWTVPVSDPAGVWRVVVVYDDGIPNAEGQGEWAPLELTEESPGLWTGSLQMPPTPQLTYTLQAVDARGNVSWLLYDLAGPTPSGIPLELPWLVDVNRVTLSAGWVDGAEKIGEQTATVQIPLQLETFGGTVSALDFELEHDPTCLDPDLNGDGEVDYTTDLPAGYVHDVVLTEHGVRAILYNGGSAVEGLPNGRDFLNISYAVICQTPAPPPLAPSTSPVNLGAAAFGDEQGIDIPGNTIDGGVRIWPGPRGDCNANSLVNAVDIVAVGEEIADGDGDIWYNAIYGSFFGSPVGCDANGDLTINAADVTCTNRLVFDQDCGAPVTSDSVASDSVASESVASDSAASAPGVTAPEVATPKLTVAVAAPTAPGEPAWIRVRFNTAAEAGALALALELDPEVFDLSSGIIDTGTTDLKIVSHDATGGKLDVVLADLSFQPLAEDAVLAEIAVDIAAPLVDSCVGLCNLTPGLEIVDVSFGSVAGVDLPGEVHVNVDMGTDLLFYDGFESGDMSSWSAAQR